MLATQTEMTLNSKIFLIYFFRQCSDLMGGFVMVYGHQNCFLHNNRTILFTSVCFMLYHVVYTL